MSIFDLIIEDKETVELNDVFLDEASKNAVEQLIKEHRYIDQLSEYGLPVNNKILLQGHSGCGKTMTAKAIAQELKRPIIILNLSNIVNARIGETAQNLKQLFDKASRDKAVLFYHQITSRKKTEYRPKHRGTLLKKQY